jgi:hypothetical protein
MNAQSIIQDVFVCIVVVSSVLYWTVLVESIIADYNKNKQARARGNKNNNKPARLTYGDESPAEVERMYREAGLIK